MNCSQPFFVLLFFYSFIQIKLTYNIVLVEGIQHKDL